MKIAPICDWLTGSDSHLITRRHLVKRRYIFHRRPYVLWIHAPGMEATRYQGSYECDSNDREREEALHQTRLLLTCSEISPIILICINHVHVINIYVRYIHCIYGIILLFLHFAGVTKLQQF